MGKVREIALKGRKALVWVATAFIEMPVEAIVCAMGVAAAIMLTHGIDGDIETSLESFLMYMTPVIAVAFSLNRLRKGRGACVCIAYWASLILVVPVLLWMGDAEFGWWLGVLYLVSLIAIFYTSSGASDEEYARHFVHIILGISVTVITAGVLTGLTEAIFSSLEALFDIQLKNFYAYVAEFIGIGVAPVVMLKLFTGKEDVIDVKRLVSALVNFVFSPALVIYAAILLLYIIKIIVKGELPQGGVAYMVLGFLALALLTRVVASSLEKSHFKWFHENIPFISIPSLILLWVGIIRRLTDYGFTEARIYLLILSLVVTAYIAVLMVERLAHRNGSGRFKGTFQTMTVVLAAVAVLITFIPGISAKALGDRYIASHDSPDTENETENETPANKVYKEYRLEGTVDISGYREILPKFSYQLVSHEDGTFEVIYEERSLITVNALERIDTIIGSAPDGNVDPMDVLVYENEDCKIVFSVIYDWRPGMSNTGKPLIADSAFVLLK
ncbi:MAG: DUF4153 domain-containing protein [Bacteroidales bacterium]|nr:DUF4153 domain-containing protein [Bacteroidales bacterium]